MDAEENQRQVSLCLHSPWKSHKARFPHSHSRGEARKSGKRKARFPLSRLLFTFSKRIRKETWQRSLRARLQAHSSMRICCSAMLSVLYANGQGVKKNLPLAL